MSLLLQVLAGNQHLELPKQLTHFNQGGMYKICGKQKS